MLSFLCFIVQPLYTCLHVGQSSDSLHLFVPGWESVNDWKDVLSGGEKQRMGMARMFYHKWAPKHKQAEDKVTWLSTGHTCHLGPATRCWMSAPAPWVSTWRAASSRLQRRLGYLCSQSPIDPPSGQNKSAHKENQCRFQPSGSSISPGSWPRPRGNTSSPSNRKYHSHILQFDGEGGWRFERLDATTRLSLQVSVCFLFKQYQLFVDCI